MLGDEGRAGTPLGYLAGPKFAFLALDVTKAYGAAARDVKRSLVLLEGGVLVSFALVTPAAEGSESVASVDVYGADAFERMSEVDIAGVRIADWAVTFYTDSHSARSPFSFDAAGSGRLRFVVTGLAPGTWEIWHAGYLTDPEVAVPREAGAAYFEGPAGGYFFRKL